MNLSCIAHQVLNSYERDFLSIDRAIRSQEQRILWATFIDFIFVIDKGIILNILCRNQVIPPCLASSTAVVKLRTEDGISQEELTQEINVTIWLINWVILLILFPDIPEIQLNLPRNILVAAREIISFYTLLEEAHSSPRLNYTGNTRIFLSLRVEHPHRRASWASEWNGTGPQAHL